MGNDSNLDHGITDHFNVEIKIVKNLGTTLLILMLLDSYYESKRDKRIESIESLMESFDIGMANVYKATENIARDIYPECIFMRNLNDIVDLAFQFKDHVFIRDILQLALNNERQIRLTVPAIANLLAIISEQQIKQSKPGAPPKNIFEQNMSGAKFPIITGFLSAGRRRIVGIKTLIDVKQAAATILGSTPPMVAKHCYERKYNSEGVFRRSLIEAIAMRVLGKSKERPLLPIPTAMEIYVVLFRALYYDLNIWTAQFEDGVPILKMV